MTLKPIVGCPNYCRLSHTTDRLTKFIFVEVLLVVYEFVKQLDIPINSEIDTTTEALVYVLELLRMFR